MFGFIKEVKSLQQEFSVYAIYGPTQTAGILYHTPLKLEVVYLKLVTNQNEVFGALRLKRWVVTKTITLVERACCVEKHRNRGIVRQLYSFAVELRLELICDGNL